MSSYFWFAAGALSAIAVAFVFVPLRLAFARSMQQRAWRLGVLALTIVVFIGGALALYRILGQPEAIEAATIAAPPPHPGADKLTAGEPGESVEAAAAKLEARIQQQGGSRGDWLLLAQSYDFLGRTEDAARARAQAEGAPQAAPSKPAAVAADAESRINALRAGVKQQPRDPAAWLELANVYRQSRDFAKAGEAYRRVEALGAMTADSWADYADVLGSLAGGSLDRNAGRAIDRAIAIDANHPKALWLKASLAHQDGRYRDALAVWRKLRGLLPSDSPDARIIDLNIGEAQQLARSGGAAAAIAPQARSPIHVSGTVTLDAKLAGRVTAGDALFIYAKAVDSPGPPLAVLRTAAGSWPVSFRLDDTLAMLPSRKLSSFDKVVVEARISRAGQATAGSGDLYAVSPVLRPADGKALQLVISREIG